MSKWEEYKETKEIRPPSEKLGLLIVDDEENIVFTLKKLFEGQYNVLTTSDAKNALEIFKREHPAIVIVDQRMPELEGLDLLDKIRDIDPDCIKILITGYSDIGVLIKAMKKRLLFCYVNKPWQQDELEAIVSEGAEIYKMMQKNKRLEKEKAEYIQLLTQMNEKLEDTVEELEETRAQLVQSNEELRKSKEKVEEYSKTLEEKVEDRTKELRAAQDQLVQSAKMATVGQLGAGVAHELNNPLGGVLGYAQFILEKLRKPGFSIEEFKTYQRYIEYIEREAVRCKKIVENLLKFSRRPPSPKPVPVDISKAIEETLCVTGHQMEVRNISVFTDFKPDLAKVMGVSNQLQQVFTNLILNAQQAMPEGGELRIIADNIIDEETQTPNYVKIEFSDTGCGITKENLPRLFEPFFTTRQKEKGTGLGLSVSYQIIQEHKGTIEVESRVGEGTIFTITLPAINNK